MIGYSTATILYMNKAIIGKKITASERLKALSQQIHEKGNAMSMIIDHIDVLQKKLDMAIDVLPGLKGEIAHSEQEILGLLSQLRRIQPDLSVANRDLTHEFTALSHTVGRLSTFNDRKVKESVRLTKTFNLGPKQCERLLEQWTRMRDEIEGMMQEWSDKANEASAMGDDSAKDEEPVILSVYNTAVAGV